MKIQVKQRIGNVLIGIGCILAIMLAFMRYESNSAQSYYNKARVMVSSDLAVLEQQDAQAEYNSIDKTYYVIDLTGTITAEHNSKFSIGDTVDVTESIQTDNSYYKENPGKVKVTFPLQKDGKVNGFVIFLLEKQDVTGRDPMQQFLYVFSPVLIMLLILYCIIVERTEKLICHFVIPMEEISDSAKAIVRGNYDLAVVKNHSKKIFGSVTDTYIYAFELMRDELKTKEIRENQLKRAQKELMSCISHDLRTPLSTIKAYGEGLRDGLARDDQTKKEYLDTIVNKTEVMSKMMKDLLDETNAEINELTIQKEERYAESYFDKIIRELAILLEQKGITFISENQVPDMLIAIDEDRITQVIYNLVENSIKYIDKEQKEIGFSAVYDNLRQVIEVSVWDNGPGIGIMDIPFVFDKFYRAEKSRNMSIPGAGLGLSICKYIVEAHGGEICLDSQKKDGCKFTFTLLV